MAAGKKEAQLAPTLRRCVCIDAIVKQRAFREQSESESESMGKRAPRAREC